MKTGTALFTALLICLPFAAHAADGSGSEHFDGTVDRDGAVVNGSGGHAPGRAATPRNRTAPGTEMPAEWSPPVEYRDVPSCPENSPSNPEVVFCLGAIEPCAKRKNGRGYLSRVYMRRQGENSWSYLGATCAPEEITGEAPRKELTVADIQRVFTHLSFATPVPSMQPVDNQSLINLPVYFQMSWPPEGHQPGSTHSADLLGHRIDIAVTLQQIEYIFGDGQSSGPTRSVGGPYPTGDIRHAYRTAGIYSPSVTVALGANYRVDGGPWATLPGISSRNTSFPQLTVHTASNRLRS
ncbi:hypothetical protein SAMN05421595_1152 [Austwickia chelonae]|uniref:PKD domain-containing protein n=1 Tax=Austwickia chelonae NBRC 105200 TaxID=1184607 RepID=K6VPM2_9MICO|nr:hypothetical protein [Austwickia chelonae]GAB77325.1 hypothetical protein AUCHE_05_02300 [Austwickia chelonae NBRC 105200]SEW07834.1 hypothetical protein SAMN05421595_1152 [Austwickia chelonae]